MPLGKAMLKNVFAALASTQENSPCPALVRAPEKKKKQKQKKKKKTKKNMKKE